MSDAPIGDFLCITFLYLVPFCYRSKEHIPKWTQIFGIAVKSNITTVLFCYPLIQMKGKDLYTHSIFLRVINKMTARLHKQKRLI